MTSLQIKTIIFCWIPSHSRFHGNEKADVAAKNSLKLNTSNIKVPYTDYKPLINDFILKKWQDTWNNCQNNKLFKIKPSLKETTTWTQKITQRSGFIPYSDRTHTHTHNSLLPPKRRRSSRMHSMPRNLYRKTLPTRLQWLDTYSEISLQC